MRPHRQQPTRLPRPWDSQGKNTGVGCHFLRSSFLSRILNPGSSGVAQKSSFCLPIPAGLPQAPGSCSAWPECPVLVTGRCLRGKTGAIRMCPFSRHVMSWLSRWFSVCLQIAQFVCLISYVIFVVAFSEDFGLILLFLMA